MNKEKIKANLEGLRKFDKNERSSFPYWWNHWKAYNLVAIELGKWKFKYLFHDIEKPFIRLFVKYETVQRIHRNNNNHHIEWLENKLKKECEKRGGLGSYDIERIVNSFDFEGAIIDWECSRYTKISKSKNAYDETLDLFSDNIKFSEKYPKIYFYCYDSLFRNLLKTLRNFGLNTSTNSKAKRNESVGLNDAAEKYAYEMYPSEGVGNVEIELAFKAGAKWQEEQGETHGTRICHDNDGWLKIPVHKDCTNLSAGDNAKVQIIKI